MKITLPGFVRAAAARLREAERVDRLERGLRRSGGSIDPASRRTRKDGSPFTKPSLDARRQLRRRQNACVKQARKEQR